MRELTYAGARERYGDALERRGARSDSTTNCGVVADMGFSDYFLVVWDLIRHAREKGIRVGPGPRFGRRVLHRLLPAGSSTSTRSATDSSSSDSSIPGRKQMPDIDMDFDERYRGDMIRYAAERYGSDHVAQIVTFSTIKARAAVRDAARVLGYPPQLGDKIAKAMPPLVMGQDLPLAGLLQADARLRGSLRRGGRTAHALRERPRGDARRSTSPRDSSTSAAKTASTRPPW